MCRGGWGGGGGGGGLLSRYFRKETCKQILYFSSLFLYFFCIISGAYGTIEGRTFGCTPFSIQHFKPLNVSSPFDFNQVFICVLIQKLNFVLVSFLICADDPIIKANLSLDLFNICMSKCSHYTLSNTITVMEREGLANKIRQHKNIFLIF